MQLWTPRRSRRACACLHHASHRLRACRRIQPDRRAAAAGGHARQAQRQPVGCGPAALLLPNGRVRPVQRTQVGAPEALLTRRPAKLTGPWPPVMPASGGPGGKRARACMSPPAAQQLPRALSFPAAQGVRDADRHGQQGHGGPGPVRPVRGVLPHGGRRHVPAAGARSEQPASSCRRPRRACASRAPGGGSALYAHWPHGGRLRMQPLKQLCTSFLPPAPLNAKPARSL
jgi:hypothetical protein